MNDQEMGFRGPGKRLPPGAVADERIPGRRPAP